MSQATTNILVAITLSFTLGLAGCNRPETSESQPPVQSVSASEGLPTPQPSVQPAPIASGSPSAGEQTPLTDRILGVTFQVTPERIEIELRLKGMGSELQTVKYSTPNVGTVPVSLGIDAKSGIWALLTCTGRARGECQDARLDLAENGLSVYGSQVTRIYRQSRSARMGSRYSSEPVNGEVASKFLNALDHSTDNFNTTVDLFEIKDDVSGATKRIFRVESQLGNELDEQRKPTLKATLEGQQGAETEFSLSTQTLGKAPSQVGSATIRGFLVYRSDNRWDLKLEGMPAIWIDPLWE